MSGPSQPCRKADHQWLREHAQEYPGQWLLLLHGELVASGRLSIVLEQSKDAVDKHLYLLHFQPDIDR